MDGPEPTTETRPAAPDPRLKYISGRGDSRRQLWVIPPPPSQGWGPWERAESKPQAQSEAKPLQLQKEPRVLHNYPKHLQRARHTAARSKPRAPQLLAQRPANPIESSVTPCSRTVTSPPRMQTPNPSIGPVIEVSGDSSI